MRHGVNIAISFYEENIFLNLFSYGVEKHFSLVDQRLNIHQIFNTF